MEYLQNYSQQTKEIIRVFAWLAFFICVGLSPWLFLKICWPHKKDTFDFFLQILLVLALIWTYWAFMLMCLEIYRETTNDYHRRQKHWIINAPILPDRADDDYPARLKERMEWGLEEESKRDIKKEGEMMQTDVSQSDTVIDYQLELLSYRAYRKNDHMVVEGRVKNISSKVLNNPMMQIKWYDRYGTFINGRSTPIDYEPLLIGQSSPFKIKVVRRNPRMERFSFCFNVYAREKKYNMIFKNKQWDNNKKIYLKKKNKEQTNGHTKNHI